MNNSFVKFSNESTSNQSFNDFLENAPEKKCDLVDGYYILNSPVTPRHNQIRRFLEALLQIYVEEKDLGQIFSENFPVRLNKRNWREPDIFFVSKERQSLLQGNVFTGAPNLIIDILSEESKYRDEVRKKAEYEQLGVEEYWIIHPDSFEHSTFYARNETRYEQLKFTKNEIISQQIHGFFIKKEWIWGKSGFPNILQAIKDYSL